MYALETIEKVFSLNIRKLRGKRTQAEMAEFAGMAFSTYRNLEQGNNLPERPQRELLAKTFGVPETALFADPDLVPKPTNDELLEMLAERLKSIEKLSTPKQDLIKLIESAAFDDAKAEKYLALFGFNDSGNPPVKSVSNPGKMKSRIS